MPKEVRGGSHEDVGEASRYPNVDYKYREALAALDKKFIEAKVALDKESIEAKAALKEESSEALAALDKKFTEAKVALDKEHIEAKEKLEKSTKVTPAEKEFLHLYESHHVYAYNSYKGVLKYEEDGKEQTVSRDEGPAIRMDREDHRKTASCGTLGEEYRKAQRDLLKQGKFGEAWMMDVKDIRSKPDLYPADKYNLHLVEAEAQLLKLDNAGKIQLEDKFKQELLERQAILKELTEKQETKVDGLFVYSHEEVEECKNKLKEIYDRLQAQYEQEQVLVMPETEHILLDIEEQQVEFEPEQNLTLSEIEHSSLDIDKQQAESEPEQNLTLSKIEPSPLDIDNAMPEWKKIRNEEIAEGKTTIDAVYAANADLYRKVTGESYGDSPEKLSNVLSQEIEERHGIDCKQAFEKHNLPNTNDQQQEQSQGITY